MGELLDRLERTSRGWVQPLGFGGAAHREKIPPILLVGVVKAGNDEEMKRAIEAGVDAILVAAGSAKKAEVDRSVKALKGVLWGLWSDEAVAALPEKCDFQVFTSDASALGALGGEEATNFMQVSPDWEDSLLRTIEDLPVDGFLVSMTDASALTMRQVMRIARVRSVTGKWLLLQLGIQPSKEELEQLRDLGVNALVTSVADQSAEALKECRQTLLDLPHQRPKTKDRPNATLPSIRPSAPVRREEEDDDDDDD